MTDDTDTAIEAPVAAPPPLELTITLDKPIMFGAVEYATITLREPTIGELTACDDKGGYAWIAALIAQVAAIPDGAVKRIPVSKSNEASAYLARFIDAGRRTTPSS